MTTPRYTFFLAHAGADTDRARELYDLLLAGGVATFLDVVDLLPGAEWDRAVAEAQHAALATVALVSDAAEEAYYLRDEIAAGIAYQRAAPDQHRLIPVFLDGQPTDSARIPYGLHIKVALDARVVGGLAGVAAKLQQIAATLHGQAAPETAPPARRAPERLRLYQALCGLGDREFEEILLLASPHLGKLAPPQAARPFRARSVVQWAEQQGEATYKLVLERALKLTPWLAWLAYRYKESALVRVPGPDREVAFDAGDLVVPLQLQLHRRGVGDELTARGRHNTADAAEVVTGSFHDAFRVVEQRTLCLGLAIIGDPGSGKTTLLQQIFCAAHARGSQALGLPPDLTPVFVRCKTFERVEREKWSFPALVEAQAAADGHAGAAAALFADERPLLLLLDGLDEVRDEDVRQALCAWLSDAALVHRDQWRFVVTSRIATWRRKSRLSEDHFLTADVLALDEPTIRRYVDLWFTAVRHRERLNESEAKLDEDAHAQAQALLDELYSDERRRDSNLLELMRNPLSLALLCQVHTRHDELPTRRGKLYEACLHVFLERRPKQQARPHLPAEATRAVLQPLAWAMQSRAADDLPRAQIEREIGPHLRRWEDLAGLNPHNFVKVAWEECGLFRSRDFNSLGFFHAALREYLAATYAVEERRLTDLAFHAAEDRWRNVLLLAMSVKGGFSGLAQALLQAGQLASHEDLLRDGLRGAVSVEPEPFVAALRAAAPARPRRRAWLGPILRALGQQPETRTAPEDVLAILRLFQDRDKPEILDAARSLQDHDDERVRRGVAQALPVAAAASRARADGRVAMSQAPAPPAPGALWREPVTGITFVWIPPGEFLMGSSKTPGQPNYDAAAFDDELPARCVRLTYGFWMAQHAVTNEVYGRFLAAAQHREPEYWRNARFNKPEQPVVGVDVNDALAFCEWATKTSALEAGRQIDLPTEAEWEYTARSAGGDGQSRRYPWGSEEPTPERAVFGGANLAAIGGRPTGATPLGVHDMAGNVLEWCLDPWGNYPKEPPEVEVEPRPSSPRAAARVVRGGSWIDHPGHLRAAFRLRYVPGHRNQLVGFRVVCRGSRQHVGL